MEKFLLSNFVFCINLRKGCIVIGILGIVGRTWAGIGSGIGWIYFGAHVRPWQPIICISNGIVGIISGITLLYGTVKNKETWIKKYLPITGFLVVLLSVSASLGIYTLKYLGGHSPIDDSYFIWTVYTLVLDIIDVLAYLYFIICVYSYLHRVHDDSSIPIDSNCSNQEHLMMS